MTDAKEKITLEDCLEMLNIPEEEFRAFYEERLDPEAVALAVELRDLFRRLFDLFLADDIDFDAIEATTEAINEIMLDIQPARKTGWFVADWRDRDIEDIDIVFGRHSQQVTEGNPLWEASQVQIDDMSWQTATLWDALLEIIERDALLGEVNLGKCEECGDFYTSPAKARGQRFCSDACRQRAYRRRKTSG